MDMEAEEEMGTQQVEVLITREAQTEVMEKEGDMVRAWIFLEQVGKLVDVMEETEVEELVCCQAQSG